MWEMKLKKVHREEPQLAHSPQLGLCHYQFRTYSISETNTLNIV